jgi:hypothetical protein
MYAVGAYLCGLPDRQDISADAWALVLAALPAVRQTQLQALLEAIDAELERIILTGDDDPGAERAARRAVDVLEPARALVAGLPWTTLEPDPATDEHARRRATLSVEVEWEREERSPVPVVWFIDGYQTPVCIVRVHVDLQCLGWGLLRDGEVVAQRLLYDADGLAAARAVFDADGSGDPRAVARAERRAWVTIARVLSADLEDAIAWGAEQLAGYTVQPWQSVAGPEDHADGHQRRG